MNFHMQIIKMPKNQYIKVHCIALVHNSDNISYLQESGIK